MIKLTVFLGNPGSHFNGTRHNLARIVRSALVGNGDLVWREKFKGRVADRGIDGDKIRFLEPGSFMNLSGESVSAAATFFKMAPSEILVVHDDLELPYGTAGFRRGGGMSGHNGLRSIRDSLGTPDFHRFRLGIGRPARGSVRSWVLGRFTPEEEAVLPEYARGAASIFEAILRGDSEDHRQTDRVVVVPWD